MDENTLRTTPAPATAKYRIDFGDVFGKSWNIYVKNFWFFVLTYLLAFAPLQLLAFVVEDGLQLLWIIALYVIVVLVYSFTVPVLIMTSMMRAAKAALDGASLRFGSDLKNFKGWTKLLATQLLCALIFLLVFGVGMAIVVGAFMYLPQSIRLPVSFLCGLGLIIGSIYLAMYMGFTPAVTALDGEWGVSAIKKSAALVRGQWWRVFGYSLLYGIIIGGVSFVIGLLFGGFTVAFGKNTLFELFYITAVDAAGAFSTIFATVFYLLFKREREGV